MTTAEEIQKLEKRKEMAVFQRKITTQIWTAIEYDQEIDAIDRKLEQLRYRLKSEQKQALVDMMRGDEELGLYDA